MNRSTDLARRLRHLVALILAVIVLGGCSDGDDEPGPDQPPASRPSGSATPTPSVSPSATATPTVTAPVYFLVDTRTGIRLARERHVLDGADPAKAAVEAMIAGAADPDYSSPWAPGTQVLSVRRANGVIEVDLSADARRANAGSETAARMVQQLVYTVTEVLGPTAAVQLLIEGQPAGELWGVLVWDEPVRRDPPVDVRLLVGIDSPVEGATVTSPVTVSGTAAVFEATLPWRVLTPAGEVIAQGTAMTSEGQRFAPYTFTFSVPPGRYVVQVEEDDPSGGAGGTPMTDTRTITIG